MARLLPDPENASVEEIKISMRAASTQQSFLRLQAIYFLITGSTKKFVADATLTSQLNLNRWIHRYNRHGIDGLLDKPRSGRPPVIGEDVAKRIQQLLDDPTLVEKQHWSLRQLHGYLREEMRLECGYSTLVRKVHEEGYVLRFPRSQAVQRNEQDREQYLEKLNIWKNEGYQLWYVDECGVDGDPRPRRRWVPKGDAPTIPYSGNHLRESVVGAVCPTTGEIQALQIPYCDSDFFQVFLDQLTKNLSAQKVLLIMDRASWHRAKKLDWHGIKHEYLPAYSPDFNPIERLWLVLKARFFTDWIAKSHEQLSDRITMGLKSFFLNEPEVMSICKN